MRQDERWKVRYNEVVEARMREYFDETMTKIENELNDEKTKLETEILSYKGHLKSLNNNEKKKLIDIFLTEHLPQIERMKSNGELKVREDHKPMIKKFLAECEFPHIEEVRELLRDVRTISEQEEPHSISHFRI